MVLASVLLGIRLQWKLVWGDEFDKAGRPDPKKWDYERGFIRNKEPQWYQPENAWVEGGNLIIEARREHKDVPGSDPTSPDWRKNRASADFTSACIITKNRHHFTYGKIEVRARFNPEDGIWPAIWFKGPGEHWPRCGEVDLMEYYKQTLLANACWGEKTSVWDSSYTPIREFLGPNPAWGQQFHVWTMLWDENEICLAVDGRILNTIDLTKTVFGSPEVNPFHGPLYLLMNMAVGATGGDTSKTKFPTRLEVDWVRAYERG